MLHRRVAFLRLGSSLVAMAVASFAGPTFGAETSVRDTLAATYRTNPRLAGQRASLRASDEQIAQAKQNWFRPTVNATGGVGWSREKTSEGFDPAAPGTSAVAYETRSTTPDVDLSLDLPIFRSGQTAYLIRAAEAGVDADQWDLVATEQDVLGQAARAHGNVVLYRSCVAIAKRQVEAYEPLLAMSRDMYQSRTATITDMAQVELELAQARANLATYQGAVDVAEARYTAVVGREPTELSPLPRLSPGVETLEAAEKRAMKHDPLIQSANSSLRESESSVSQKKSGLLPTVGLSASFQKSWERYDVLSPKSFGSDTRDSRTGSVGVMASVPIYSGGVRYSYVRQALQEEAVARQNSRETRLVQLATLRGLWHSRLAYERVVETYVDALSAAHTAVEGKMREYKNGTTTMQEVLLVQESLYNVMQDRAFALYDLFSTEVSLLQSLGTLTAGGFDLPVTRYDPEKYRREVDGKWIGW